MNSTLMLGLVYNATLLLAIALLFDMTSLRMRTGHAALRQIPIGIVLGIIGITIMLNSHEIVPGITFDTRSVLLGIAGLYFGLVPTVIAAAMTALMRLYQGGGGAVTGITVILSSGLTGILWRHCIRTPLERKTWWELLLFGAVVHAVMLLWMLTLPSSAAGQVLSVITVPVMAVFPLATSLLGMLMTNRLRREEVSVALRDSEEKYRVLVENAGEAVLVASGGMLLFVNPKAEEIIGYPREHLLSRPFMEFIHPDYRELIAQNYRQRMAGESVPFFYSFQIIHADGTYRWVDIRSVRIQWMGLPATLNLLQDITDSKKAADGLRESEARYIAFINATTDMVFLKDTQFRYTLVNSAMAEFFGRPPEGVRGLTDYDLMPEEAASNCRRTDIEALASKSIAVNEEIVGGEVFETAKFPVRIGKVNVVGGIIRNITERKRAALGLEQALVEKQALLRELQHRIKNSLSMIVGLIDIDAERRVDPGMKMLLKDLGARVGSMANLYTILFQSGSVARVGLDEYMGRIIQSLRDSYVAAGSGISIVTRLEPIEVETRSAAPLGLIVNELLTNALKYAFPEGRTGAITVTMARRGEGITLCVEDDGVGPPEGFDPESAGGLGLELVKMMARQLDGSMEYERRETTRFTVRAGRI
ncbi:MAG: PAS domain S-box protein [Spirochaetes bacterium]|nr:PAS domain S-box protein [Spirochaetota bacterium]